MQPAAIAPPSLTEDHRVTGEARKVLVLEFNELCPDLLTKWMADGKLPNFKRFHDQSEVFITEADESDPRNLEPWIQWYSIHTGLPYREHKVFHLTDGAVAAHTDIWQILAKHKKRVANCSSMNAKRIDVAYSLFLPDPWCTNQKAHPDELHQFHKFIARAVQEYSNVDFRLKLGDYLSFATFLLTHRLRVKTIAALLAQIAAEIASNGSCKWRRAACLDKLQLDVFLHYFRKFEPDFGTFFVNSTAHFQHAYWRHMSPENFVVVPSERELKIHKDSILYGYQQMDELLADFFELEKEGVMLILMTALSQQPYLKHEAIGGHRFYRPRDFERLLNELGIAYKAVLPTMTHQYMIHFDSLAAKKEAESLLSRMRWEQNDVFQIIPGDGSSLYVGCQIRLPVPSDARIQGFGQASQSVAFFDLFYQIDAIKSGRHHPDGVLWFKVGRHNAHTEKVSILDLLPTVLDYLGVSAASDRLALSGRNLLPALNASQTVVHEEYASR